MKRIVVALTVAAAVAAAPASAFTFFSIGATTGPGPGDPGLGPNATSVVTFDASNAAGVTDTTTGNVALYTGTTPGVAAAPVGDTTTYQAIGTGGTSTFDFTGLEATKAVNSVSVYVGSVDTYNYIDVLNKNLQVIGTISGSQLPGNNGDQGASITNRRLYISFTPSDNFGGLTFRSSGVAFEYDTIGASSVAYSERADGFDAAGSAAGPRAGRVDTDDRGLRAHRARRAPSPHHHRRLTRRTPTRAGGGDLDGLVVSGRYRLTTAGPCHSQA